MKITVIEEIPQGPGTYVLVMRLDGASSIVVGRLGELSFGAGYYLYVGSALAGLRPRLARHLRSEKRHHWHIDYLLDVARIAEIWCIESEERLECQWAELLRHLIIGAHKGFGASDCRCKSHLLYAPAQPDLSRLAATLDRDWLVQRWCSADDRAPA